MLQSVLGFSELSILKPDEKQEYFHKASQSMTRFSQLCHNIHNYSNGPLISELKKAEELVEYIDCLDTIFNKFKHQTHQNLEDETLEDTIGEMHKVMLNITKISTQLKYKSIEELLEYEKITGDKKHRKTVDDQGKEFKNY